MWDLFLKCRTYTLISFDKKVNVRAGVNTYLNVINVQVYNLHVIGINIDELSDIVILHRPFN
jgi:hypothetical protein